MIFQAAYDEKNRRWVIMLNGEITICEAINSIVASETALLLTEFRKHNP